MWCWMIKNKKLLDTFATMTLREAIKPIKKNIIAIETNETTFWLSYFDFSENELTLYADPTKWNPVEQWSLDTNVKVSGSNLEIEGTKLSFLVGAIHKFN